MLVYCRTSPLFFLSGWLNNLLVPVYNWVERGVRRLKKKKRKKERENKGGIKKKEQTCECMADWLAGQTNRCMDEWLE